MGFTVKLGRNASPVEKIGKDITWVLDVTGVVLKEQTSILKPVLTFLVSGIGITECNYMYIEALQRYYFIDDISSVNNNKWEVSGHVDVLETFKNGILANDAVIRRQTNLYNTYLNDPEWKTYAYEQVAAFKFPITPFTKSLSYILTVAGA